jgi:GR25 family glycosyltransferase involved in LPS biosynthesis
MLELLASNYCSTLSEHDAEVLMRALRCYSRFHIGSAVGSMLVKFFPHNITIKDEYALCVYYSRDVCKAYDIFQEVLDLKGLTESMASHTLYNQHFCIKAASAQTTYYDRSIVDKLVNSRSNNLPQVTLTITSCKRFALFKKTVNSFLNCCQDLHKIDRWICVDDNSSTEDREEMKKLYPFFEFHFKNLDCKGHPQSMNLIRDLVKTPFMFHMEDDWHFFAKIPYITNTMDVLGQDTNIKQCLLNRNYSETEETTIIGGEYKTSITGRRYYVHEHVKTPEELEKWTNAHGNGMNCNYWPHFSLRPGLWSTTIMKNLGKFDENCLHFEKVYAEKYISKGWKTAFLEGIYCLHIGRLTSEINDHTKPNAYVLNNENQFSKTRNVSESDDDTSDYTSDNTSDDTSNDTSIETYIINLDRRTDRWLECEEKIKNISSLNTIRFSAIDGCKLKSTLQLQRIFDGNDFNMRQGIVGCAMSHLCLYVYLANKEHTSNDVSNENIYCILEDDIEFVPEFDKKLRYLKNLIQDNDWDLVYLAHHLRDEYITSESYSKTKMPRVEQWSRHEALTRSLGGTGGYLISKNGIHKLLSYIEDNGITNGIDTVQQKAADIMKVLYATPHLIYSECVRNSTQSIDSDIQHNYESLSMLTSERKIGEILKYGNVIDLSKISFDDMLKLVASTINSATLMWESDDSSRIIALVKASVHPYQIINDKVFFLVPNGKNKVSKLKNDDKWSLDNVFAYKP